MLEMDSAEGLLNKKEMSSYRGDLLNPFELKQSLTGVQIFKVSLMTVILPLKLLLMLLVLSLAWIICVITLTGLPMEEAQGIEPLTGWRRRWAKPFLSRMCRFVFFIGGYMHVPQRGHRASRKEAPILLVVPHSSFFDTALVTVLHCPGLVVRDFTAKAPFFGDLIRYTQPLYVSSENQESRRLISEAIRQRVQSDKNFEQLMLFPEGGCGNRKAVLQFKLGAFNPGVSIQPVFVRYKNNLDTITWTWEGPDVWNRLFLTLTQFRIYCELEFLPVYKPSDLEKQNPRLFANNVQHYISSWAGCPVTHFAVEDAPFLQIARNLQLPPTVPVVKFLRARKAIGRQDLDPAEELKSLYERNIHVDNFKGGIKKMTEYLGINRCPEALKDFCRTINQTENDELDVRIYAACLYLIRSDMPTGSKLKASFQAFESESKMKHISNFLLLWKGMPPHLLNMKSLKHFDKIENEENELESRNFF